MSQPPAGNKAVAVRSMFSRIAPRYELANHWMTWGQDVRWRQEVLRRAGLPRQGRLLDVGTGTGDLARMASGMDKALLAVGLDFTFEMMRHGRNQPGGRRISWVGSDALDLPFSAETFDAIVSGYLLRNVADIEKALAEQYRVLKQDGRVVCLDTTPPPSDPLHLPVRLYLKLIIPLIGRLISGNTWAYSYLSTSTHSFMATEKLALCLVTAGFSEVGYTRFMAGTMAIHWGVKK